MARKEPTLLCTLVQSEARRRRARRVFAYGCGMLIFWLAMFEVVALLIWAMCSTLEAIR